MASPIVSIERIRAEFYQVRVNTYELSDAEVCELVSGNLCVPLDAVRQVVEEQAEAADWEAA